MQKFEILFLMFFAFLILQHRGYAQANEENLNKSLISLSDSLKAAKRSVSKGIGIIQRHISLSPGIKESYGQFDEKHQSEMSVINKKELELSKIDISGKYMTIDGFVESRQNGMAIINSNDRLYALKSGLSLGSRFKGSVKQIPGSADYTTPRGGNATLNIYAPAKEKDPKVKYDKLNAEIEKLRQINEEHFSVFRDSLIALINSEIAANNKIIVEAHYRNAENYLSQANYIKARNEYLVVQRLVRNYKDTPKKIETVYNYLKFNKALDYENSAQFDSAAELYFELTYPAEFNSCKEKFKAVFEKWADELFRNGGEFNKLHPFIVVFDSIESKKKRSLDFDYFSALSNDRIPKLKAYIERRFSYENFQDDFVPVPEGYYYNTYGEKTPVSAFLVFSPGLDIDMLRAYEILTGNKLISQNPSSLSDNFEWLSDSEIKQVANFYKMAPLTQSDIEYIKADGWESEKAKIRYTQTEGQTNYNFIPDRKRLKILPAAITNEAPRLSAFTSIKQMDFKVSSRVDRQKEDAIENGYVFAPGRLLLAPSFSIGWNFLNWSPYPLSPDYKTIKDGYLGIEGGLFIGVNIFPSRAGSFEKFNGLGLNISYSYATLHDDGKKNDLDNYSSIKIDKFSLEGLEVELRYQAVFFLGFGYAKFKHSYESNYTNSAFTGTVPWSLKHDSNFNSFFINTGINGQYFQLFLKSYISEDKDGLFSWQSNGHINGNIMTGLKLYLPIRLFRDIPLFY
jgi:hypothetical protein